LNGTELRDLVASSLGPLADSSGSLLYSGLDTLRPGPVYVVGLNPGGPGGKPAAPFLSIADAPFVDETWSAYTRDCWKDHIGPCDHLDEDGRVREPHLAKHQRNALVLFDALALPAEQVLSTNCIFGRSRAISKIKDETCCDLAAWEAACWTVHQRLLDVVRPTWIISFGYGARTSPFGLWRQRAGSPKFRPVGAGRRGGWTYEGAFDLGEGRQPLSARMLGIPHPSYFALSEDVVDFIRSEVK